MVSVPHFIADDFLPEAMHQGLLLHTLNVDDFAVGKVVAGGKTDYLFDQRKGKISNDRLGPYLADFKTALRTSFGDICRATGVAQFDLAEIEIRLAAHSDGDFFSPHRDSFTGADRAQTRGDLHIHPFDSSAPVVIEPCNNRLVAFPSFMLHEVLPVVVPSGNFADSRFSVSCWFDRARG